MTNIVESSVLVTDENCHLKASQILSAHTKLSQAKVKNAMHKGAVWLSNDLNETRLRRATKRLNPGDRLSINYNSELLSQSVPPPQLVHDAQHYSVWYKPYGLSCQGSRWGDFSSINRWVEVNLTKLTESNQRPVFLVHRLDRATSGLMLLAHSKTAARQFSTMLREGTVKKKYQAIVHGDFNSVPSGFELDSAIDGKAAKSIFYFERCTNGCSLVNIELVTGRKHQIRRHLSEIDFPIIGDRLYGNAAKAEKNLQLQSFSLHFICPYTEEEKKFSVADEYKLQLQ